MDVMVVGRRAEERWSLAADLDQPASRATEPDRAQSRLAHPSVSPPDAVVLLVGDGDDLAWLAAHSQRSVRRWVPVVAVVARDGLTPAALTAGAAAVVSPTDSDDALVDQVRRSLHEVTAPAVVITLDDVRRSA